MIRLTDGTKTIEIAMQNWVCDHYTPDWSDEFYDVGGLEYDDDKNAYIVEDVDYCVDQALDWESARGDYIDDREHVEIEKRNGIERVVILER